VWEAVEASTREVRMGKTRERRGKGEEEKTEKRKNSGSKESSGRMGNMG